MYWARILSVGILLANPVNAATNSGSSFWMFGGPPPFPTLTHPDVEASAPGAELEAAFNPSLLFAVYPVDMRVQPSLPLAWRGAGLPVLALAMDLQARPLTVRGIAERSRPAARLVRVDQASRSFVARVLRRLNALPGVALLREVAPLIAGALVLVGASFGTGWLVSRRRAARRRGRRAAAASQAQQRRPDWAPSPSPLAVMRQSKSVAQAPAPAPAPAIVDPQLMLTAQKLAEALLLQTGGAEPAPAGGPRSGKGRGRSRRRSQRRMSYSGS